MGLLIKASESGCRLTQLTELRNKLAEAIDLCESMRDLSALSRQYRETIREIEEIEEGADPDDEIAEIISGREADGKSGTVRKSRTRVLRE